MTASNVGRENLRIASADLPQKKQADSCGPMSLQSPLGAHGHDMHPQEFVRLIGCSDQNKQSERQAQEQDDPLRLH